MFSDEQIKAMTRSHSELEKYHYKAVIENRYYLEDGLFDSIREEIMMNMPYHREEEPQAPKKETVFVENVTDGQFLKLKALVHDLQDRINTHIDKKKKGKGFTYD